MFTLCRHNEGLMPLGTVIYTLFLLQIFAFQVIHACNDNQKSGQSKVENYMMKYISKKPIRELEMRKQKDLEKVDV